MALYEKLETIKAVVSDISPKQQNRLQRCEPKGGKVTKCLR